jgi:glutaredoxin
MDARRRSLLSLVLLVLVVSAAVQWWHGWREARLGEALAQRAAAGDIHILASEHCDGCEFARHWLTQYGVRFTECSIDRDAKCAEALRALNLSATPVVLVRGKPQLGFDPQRVLDSLG